MKIVELGCTVEENEIQHAEVAALILHIKISHLTLLH